MLLNDENGYGYSLLYCVQRVINDLIQFHSLRIRYVQSWHEMAPNKTSCLFMTA